MTAEVCPTSGSHKAQQASGGNGGQRCWFASLWTPNSRRATLQTLGNKFMKTLAIIALGILFVAPTDSFGEAERISGKIPKKFLGRTLWDIGVVLEIHVDWSSAKEPQYGHIRSERVRQTIFEHQIADVNSPESVAMGVPPTITINYEGGMIVRAEPYAAIIWLPGEKPFKCLLLPPRASPAQHSNADAKPVKEK